MAKKESGFIHWYESYQGKRVVGMVYSLGAAVVIVGALFKILHLKGAEPMLFAGMLTEALLFSIGCFDKPHPEFHWEAVFPQLCGYGTDPEYLESLQALPRPTLLGAGVENGTAPAAATSEAKPKANVPSLTNEDMEALKGGINDLAKTAVQLTELGKVATSTTKLSEKMDAASAAAEKFAGSQDALASASASLDKTYQTVATEMQGVVDGTKNFNKGIETATKGIETVNTKLSSINSVYELQLTAVQSQAEAYKAQAAQVQAMTNDVQKIQAAVAEAAKSQEAYEAAAKKLAAQVADLNKVYGNMLTALA